MNNKKLVISILTTGRFHLLDLARELSTHGHDVHFFSYLPKRRAVKFGLPKECHRSLLPYVFPLVAWQLYFPKLFPNLREFFFQKILNLVCILTVPKSDVVIAMSGIYYESLVFLKKKYGSKINLHRGSKHIKIQDEILRKIPGAERPSKQTIIREIKGYEIADFILIASNHVYSSFYLDKDIQRKCIINSYGVDLNLFPLNPKKTISVEKLKALYAGMWTYRKGCDLISEYMKICSKIDFLHVGDLGDCPFPNTENMKHLSKVDQSELSNIYAVADFFVLASREDGFGVVLSQALASGIPVLTTYDTGGSDLQLTPSLSDNIILVESNNFQDLQRGFEYIINRLENGPPFLEITQSDREELSWKGYGARYNQFLAETNG